jgi:hypothetical protein
VGTTQVLAVEVKDEPGGLNNILDALGENEINLEYMYSFANPKCEHAVMIFRFDDLDQASRVLADNNIRVFTSREIRDL